MYIQMNYIYLTTTIVLLPIFIQARQGFWSWGVHENHLESGENTYAMVPSFESQISGSGVK